MSCSLSRANCSKICGFCTSVKGPCVISEGKRCLYRLLLGACSLSSQNSGLWLEGLTVSRSALNIRVRSLQNSGRFQRAEPVAHKSSTPDMFNRTWSVLLCILIIRSFNYIPCSESPSPCFICRWLFDGWTPSSTNDTSITVGFEQSLHNYYFCHKIPTGAGVRNCAAFESAWQDSS